MVYFPVSHLRLRHVLRMPSQLECGEKAHCRRRNLLRNRAGYHRFRVILYLRHRQIHEWLPCRPQQYQPVHDHRPAGHRPGQSGFRIYPFLPPVYCDVGYKRLVSIHGSRFLRSRSLPLVHRQGAWVLLWILVSQSQHR